MKKKIIILSMLITFAFTQPALAGQIGPKEADIIRQQIENLQTQCDQTELTRRIEVLEAENQQLKSRVGILEKLFASLRDNLITLIQLLVARK